MDNRDYRKGVNVIIIDENNKYLVIQLQEYADNEWKFIGGGADEGESYLEAMKREVLEETGLAESDYTIIGKSKHVQSYDFPETMKDKPIYKKYRGQKKAQFVIRLHKNTQIKIQEEEIKAYKWVPSQDLEKYLVFPNQLSNAKRIIEEFDITT